jgi:hypothetical protein
MRRASKGRILKLENYGRGRDYRSSSVLAFSRNRPALGSYPPTKASMRVAGMQLTTVPATLCSKRPDAKPDLGNQQEETMRRFMVHLVTEIDFVDGDEVSNEILQNYQKHLSETVQNAAQALSLRTIKDSRVESVSITEIKDEL